MTRSLEKSIQEDSLKVIRKVVRDIKRAIMSGEPLTQAQANFILKVRKDVRMEDLAVARKDLWSRMKPGTARVVHHLLEESVEAEYEVIDAEKTKPKQIEAGTAEGDGGDGGSEPGGAPQPPVE